jgi:hypothetical protein
VYRYEAQEMARACATCPSPGLEHRKVLRNKDLWRNPNFPLLWRVACNPSDL